MGYARVLHTPLAIGRYLWLRLLYQSGTRSTVPRAIRMRSLGGASLLCRPTRADIFTFKSTFLGGYHLPPHPLPRHATILDLGSNIGYTVADLAYRYPSARVVGVEMDARNYDLAVRNTAHFGPRVQLIHAAVWTDDGEIAYAGEHDDGFQVTAGAPNAGQLSAPAKRIETIMAECGIQRVDYLKMDIEGAEAAIFEHPGWLDRIESLKVEIHPPARRDAIARILDSAGFRCRDASDHPNGLCAVRRSRLDAETPAASRG